jgi:hypothetical protein
MRSRRGGISSGVPEAVRTNVAKPSPSETKETDWRMSGGGRDTVSGRYEDNSASAIFSLVYAALLGIAVFGLAIAGTTTPRWVTYRRITMQGQTPAMVLPLA